MAQRTVLVNDRSVLVEGDEDVVGSLDRVLASSQFQSWKASLDPAFSIEHITVQSVDNFGEHIGFLKMRVEARDADGDLVPGVVFLRGNAIVIFVVLVCEGEEYVPLVRQARLATGQFMLESPAGIHTAGDTITGRAIAELEEELGLKIHMEELVDMLALLRGVSSEDSPPLYLSSGACDEAIHYLLLRRHVRREDLARMHGQRNGLAAEGEKMHTVIVPFHELRQHLHNVSGWLALSLYEDLKRQCKL